MAIGPVTETSADQNREDGLEGPLVDSPDSPLRFGLLTSTPAAASMGSVAQFVNPGLTRDTKRRAC